MSLVYIFAASGMEGQPVRRIGVPSGSNSTLRCGPNDLVLITSGMGPGNARSKAEAALRSALGAPAGPKPDAVVIIGLCGGLTVSLPEGRIVVYTECRSTEATKPLLRCSQTIVNSVIELLKASSVFCDRVVGITAPHFATTPDQRLALRSRGYLGYGPARAMGGPRLPRRLPRSLTDHSQEPLRSKRLSFRHYYTFGEKSASVMNVISCFSTSGPFASVSAFSFTHSGSLPQHIDQRASL